MINVWLCLSSSYSFYLIYWKSVITVSQWRGLWLSYYIPVHHKPGCSRYPFILTFPLSNKLLASAPIYGGFIQLEKYSLNYSSLTYKHVITHSIKTAVRYFEINILLDWKYFNEKTRKIIQHEMNIHFFQVISLSRFFCM